MTTIIPRESLEFLPITVTVDGAPVTANVKVCVTGPSERPNTWVPPETVDGQIGVMTVPGTAGTFRVWAQVTDMPEIPVIYCGYYRMT